MKTAKRPWKNRLSLCKGRGFIFSGSEDLRRPGQHLGLRPSGCGAEKQCEEGLVEEVCPGEPL